MLGYNSALYEEVKVVNSFLPDSWAAGTNYNGAASGAVGIDCDGFDEATIIAHIGEVQATGTLDITVMDNSANQTSSGLGVVADVDAVTQAFAQFTPSNDNSVYIGRIQTKNCKRYLFIRAVGATAAAEFSVVVLLSKAKSAIPVTQTNSVVFKHN